MILNRLIEKFSSQNWTAISIEFFIVVFGVFLGIQASNWNNERAMRIEYYEALQRLESEIATNTKEIKIIEQSVRRAVERVDAAIEALRTCSDDTHTRNIVNLGIRQLNGTYGIHMHQSALKEISTRSDFLSLQTQIERQRFANLMFAIEFSEDDGAFSEDLPLNQAAGENPLLRRGASEVNVTFDYFGIQQTGSRRLLMLNAPVSEACENSELLEDLAIWANSQANIQILATYLRTEFELTQALLLDILQ